VFRFAARLQSVSFATALAVLVVCAPAEAVTFNVTKPNDSADGSCDADCSLREAVIAANAAGGADTVLLPAGAYDLTIADASAGIDEDAGATGDLDIAPGGLTLQGAGAVATSIDAKTLGNRIVHVLGYYSDSPIAIRGVTLEGGDSSAQGGSAEGGSSVRVDDSFPGLVVTLDDVVVDKSGAGASAVRSVATLVVTDCTFSGNAAGSATSNWGLGELREVLRDLLMREYVPLTVQLPYNQLQLLSLGLGEGEVTETEYQADHVQARVRVAPRLVERYRPYVIAESDR